MLKEDYKHLNRLSEINNNTGVKFLNRAATPGSHCPMHTALATLTRITGVSSLVVGTAECGYYSRYVMKTPYGKLGELHYVYELDSNEVVFGCREGLKKAMLQMADEGAKVIMIIMTCIPALIGEDPQSLIEELEPMIDCKIAFVDLAHFKRNGYQSGYYLVLEQLIDLLEPKKLLTQEIKEETKEEIKEEIKEDVKKNKRMRMINFFGDAYGSEINILKQNLLENGFLLNIYGMSSSMEELAYASSAEVTIVLSHHFLQAAKRLENKYSVPYIPLFAAYHKEDIKVNYKLLETLLSVKFKQDLYQVQHPLEQVIEEIKDIIIEIKEKVQEVCFISTNAEIDILPLVEFLCNLGMSAQVLHLEEFHSLSMEWKEKILATNNDPYVTYITKKECVVDALVSTEQLISIGDCYGVNKNHTISDVELRKIMVGVGFERSIALVTKLREVVDSINSREEQINGTL